MQQAGSTGRPIVPDEDIVLLMMEGDEEGLRHLLKSYGGKVRGVLRAELSETALTEEDFEEAVCDAAWAVYRSAEAFDRWKSKLSTYFARLALHAAIDKLRKQRRSLRTMSYEELAEIGREPSVDPRTDGQAPPAELERRERIRAIVDGLPRLERAIVHSDFFAREDVSDAELAQRLGSTKGSIQVLRHRAKQRLEQEIVRQKLVKREGRP